MYPSRLLRVVINYLFPQKMDQFSYSEEVKALLGPLLADYGVPFIGATPAELSHFEEKAREQSVPREVIDELARFYSVLNGINPSLDSLSIQKSGDPILYEFWETQRRLWIGQRDMDMISWQDGKFHLGDAGYLNYGEDYIFDSLLDLLKLAFSEWYSDAE